MENYYDTVATQQTDYDLLDDYYKSEFNETNTILKKQLNNNYSKEWSDYKERYPRIKLLFEEPQEPLLIRIKKYIIKKYKKIKQFIKQKTYKKNDIFFI